MAEGTYESEQEASGMPVLRARLVVELADDEGSDSYPATPEQIDRAVERFVEIAAEIDLQWEEVVCRGNQDSERIGPLFRPDDKDVFGGVIPYYTYVEPIDSGAARSAFIDRLNHR